MTYSMPLKMQNVMSLICFRRKHTCKTVEWLLGYLHWRSLNHNVQESVVFRLLFGGHDLGYAGGTFIIVQEGDECWDKIIHNRCVYWYSAQVWCHILYVLGLLRGPPEFWLVIVKKLMNWWYIFSGPLILRSVPPQKNTNLAMLLPCTCNLEVSLWTRT